MPDDVNRPTRSYDASGRRARALASRRAVIAAAQELLEEVGYSATTVVEVARRAGVSPESIYKGFGTKAALVKVVFDVAIAGDDDPVPVAERPEALAIRAEPDVREKLRLYAAGAARRGAQSARVQLALRNGAHSDPAIAELWATLQDERLAGMTMVARHLVDTGQLRAGIGVEEARDVLWACIAVEVFDLLVLQRGWTVEAYADWLSRTLAASLT
ncbi:TetR/AcrR family transcriptional regulator [Nocardioides currus]|uniref:TetR family transcriptional regulator n=1 Tax=Nocardioides currus TaxID=2133958 RepID=A0A2R7Z1I0_9ACTN|nr:TetR/AcrR family transcriptional regulator [Nocardioides currus]PUA82106.1 TetR family transcriptional regulator [Nocardioides currus]